MFCFFFFNDTATTEIYTLSLHDALPILPVGGELIAVGVGVHEDDDVVVENSQGLFIGAAHQDRKSTRLNSSHLVISYAVFCLKKKNQRPQNHMHPRCVRRLLPQTTYRSP